MQWNSETEAVWLATANSELRSEVLALKQEIERLRDMHTAANGRLRAEVERLRALVDSVLACDGVDLATHITVEIPFDLYHALEEARRA